MSFWLRWEADQLETVFLVPGKAVHLELRIRWLEPAECRGFGNQRGQGHSEQQGGKGSAWQHGVSGLFDGSAKYSGRLGPERDLVNQRGKRQFEGRERFRKPFQIFGRDAYAPGLRNRQPIGHARFYTVCSLRRQLTVSTASIGLARPLTAAQ